MKSILLPALLFSCYAYSQPVNADIKIKFELKSSSKFLYFLNYSDEKIDTISFPANNEWSYQGPVSSAGEFYITTSDTVRGAAFWVDEKPVSFLCKDSINRNGRNQLFIHNLSGSPDAVLFNERLNIGLNYSFRMLPDKTRSENDSISKAFFSSQFQFFIDSLFNKHPGSPILPYYISLHEKWLGPEITTLFYNRLPDNIKESSEGQAVKKFLDRSSLLKEGTIITDFTLPDNRDNTFRLGDVKAKYLLLDFWSSSCGPCRWENKELVKIYDTFKNKGFEIVSISIDGEKKDWLKAIKEDKLNWYNAYDLKDRESLLVERYKIGAIPFTVLLDSDKKVIATGLSAYELGRKLEKLLN